MQIVEDEKLILTAHASMPCSLQNSYKGHVLRGSLKVQVPLNVWSYLKGNL
jgi:hypothetical protein